MWVQKMEKGKKGPMQPNRGWISSDLQIKSERASNYTVFLSEQKIGLISTVITIQIVGAGVCTLLKHVQ